MRIDLRTEAFGNFQAVLLHQFALAKDFSRRAVGDDSPRVENDHTGCHVDGEFEVVGGDDLGGGKGDQ